MKRIRSLVIGCAVAALAITAVGAPAAAVTLKGKVVIVQGIPASRVDVCVNNKEVKSALPYGGKFVRTFPASQKQIKVYAKHPARCGGRLLASKRFDLLPGDDLTIVVTKRNPKVLIFDNNSYDIAAAFSPDTAGAIRHAADVGSVGFNVDLANVNPVPWVHAEAGIWEKGDHYAWLAQYNENRHVMTIDVVLPFSEFRYVGPHLTWVEAGYRYEWIFVGTNGRNTRIVVVKRPVSFL